MSGLGHSFKGMVDGFFGICDVFLEKLGGGYYRVKPGDDLGRNHGTSTHESHEHRR